MTALPAVFTLAALNEFYAKGGKPEAIIREVYRRIEEAGDPGIFISLAPMHEALAAAASLPERDAEKHPLWGVPFAAKDNIDAAKFSTTAACPGFAYTPAKDATAIAKARAAGAILIGKTNLDQFATGLVGMR